MKSLFNKGDRVEFQRTADGSWRMATFIAMVGGLAALEVDEPVYNHDCDGLTKAQHGEWAMPERIRLVSQAPVKPTRTFAPNSQNGKLLAYLASGNRITRIVADHMFGIASLTRRIRDLREAGHKVEGAVKIDPRGNPYTEYKLASKPQRRVG